MNPPVVEPPVVEPPVVEPPVVEPPVVEPPVVEPPVVEPPVVEPPVVEPTMEPGSLLLTLSPSTLDELKHEADEIDFSIEQLIESILEEYLESKKEEEEEEFEESESWKCTYCKPEIEFFDYFEYSNHFFEKHIQPNLQKISNKHTHF